MVQGKWKSKDFFFLFGLGVIDITAAVLSMGYYVFEWTFIPSIIPSAVHMGFAFVLYTFWFVQCTKILKKLDEDEYIRRFRSFQTSSILLLLSIVALAVSGFSDSRSYTTWIGLGFLSLGLLFTYVGFLQTRE